MALHLPSHVILDIFWIQVELDLESQLTAYLMEIGVCILHHVGLVMTNRMQFLCFLDWLQLTGG